MKTAIIALVLTAFAAVFGHQAAHAGTNTPGVDWRQKNQANRIFDGIRDGSLNRRETGRLIRGQVRVRRAERRFRRDGNVTRRERVRLHRGLNRQSRRIHRARRN